MNKTQKVKEHLTQYGNITSWEAINLYGATRLASIVYNLRQDGYDLRTIMIDDVDRYGEPNKYARYVYKGQIL